MEQSDPWNPSEKELRRRRRARRERSRKLGIELPEWEDERQAPPVDEGAIEALLDGRIDQERLGEVARLILRFRSWAEAYCRLGLQPRCPPTADNECITRRRS